MSRGVEARSLAGLVLHLVNPLGQLIGGCGSGERLAGYQGDPGGPRAGYLGDGRDHDMFQECLGRDIGLQLAGQLAQLARGPRVGAVAGAADRLPHRV